MIRFSVVVFSLLLPLQAGEHWAYVAPQKADVPATVNAVDSLLDAARKNAGVEAAGLAPPRQRIQRAADSLTGLQATAQQIQRIEASPDDATWRALIDELLTSPAYGERWARHWMDVARYADTSGYNFMQDNRYPYAFTYRDWLVRAFNDDMRYDEFVKWQIAGDLIADRADHPNLAAMGFLTVGPRSGKPEIIDDRIDVVSRGFLASTVACARCHKHKTDPISMNDYYSLYSIFENTYEPGEKPIIGQVADAAARKTFEEERAKWQAADDAVRQAFVDHLRAPESLAVYLELAWLAKQGDWDLSKATSESFTRGRYRPKAVIEWRDFLKGRAWDGESSPRLTTWAKALAAAPAEERKTLCQALAAEWSNAAAESELGVLKSQSGCPLNYDIRRISDFYDTEDGNKHRARGSELSRLLAEHPGSPPRAMVLNDESKWQDARIFLRGNPATPGEKIDREWLSFLGGGKFPEGKSPRLALAEKITDAANPLTDRVIVNRVWAWHFGAPMLDPSDFGMQQQAPVLQPLLDHLAVAFREHGSSMKELHRLLLTSRAFRLADEGPEKNRGIDEGNHFFWKWNRQRVDFESMRDRLLQSAGALDLTQRGGRSAKVDDPAMDSRRSVYAFVDRYALPNTFVAFDLPHPAHHSSRRIETIVPQQALYFLNGPLVIRQAKKLAADPALAQCADEKSRVDWIYRRIFQRPATAEEAQCAADWMKSLTSENPKPPQDGVWEALHATDQNGVLGEMQRFPMFADKVWKTGSDLSTAPVPWLHAGANSGHPNRDHALVLRWRAASAGQARMVGELQKPQAQGAALVWEIRANERQIIASGELRPEQKVPLEAPWLDIKAGESLDFLLRAPNGHDFGSTGWKLSIQGRESPDGKIRELSNWEKDFPQQAAVDANPLADLIQMLWAANEFHFID